MLHSCLYNIKIDTKCRTRAILFDNFIIICNKRLRWESEITDGYIVIVRCRSRMGKNDSSKTRVAPVFNQLLNDDPTGCSWLPREHTIRDENDFQPHCDYIHYNPVKHGHVQSPREWPHSSFRRFVKAGLYDPAWGSMQRPELPEEIGRE